MMQLRKIWDRYAVLSVMMVSFLIMPVMGSAAENKILVNLPSIYAKYEGQIEALFREYKKAETKEGKKAIKERRNDVFKAYEAEIEKFNKKTPLAGKKLPVKTDGELPFSVQNAQIVSVSTDTLRFSATVKFNRDMKDEKGQILQRETVYFCAVDKKGDRIKDTWNYATNSGWIDLTRGTEYEVRGHWKPKRVMNMVDFDHLLIVPKADYKKK
jgi:hypothetical protein